MTYSVPRLRQATSPLCVSDENVRAEKDSVSSIESDKFVQTWVGSLASRASFIERSSDLRNPTMPEERVAKK